MELDFEIEVQASEERCEQRLSVPTVCARQGAIGADDVRVYISRRVHDALEAFAASDTSRELGSILLGDYTKIDGIMHVIVSDYIEAKYTDASAVTLKFTHETWADIHQQHQQRAAESKIIGWQHTHPNYGVFLSSYDMFIQENFFDLPFQIAYVIDPIRKIRGFYQWKNAAVEKLGGYFLYEDGTSFGQ